MTAQLSEQGHASALTVTLAKSASEVREAQRLRYQVFAEECGAHLESATEGIDEDDFDSSCEHLIVRDLENDRVVGTYRILTSWKAKEVGRYYSECEFDILGAGRRGGNFRRSINIEVEVSPQRVRAVHRGLKTWLDISASLD
jgi:putative hemolysin